MDLDSAKENIQPLAGGRNISLLQFALNAEKRQKEHDELIARRREYEEQIKTYDGDDALELWLEYIHWIEQAFPRSGKESEFQEALQRCLQLFEHEDKYKQDVRMVKLYIKFIDSQPQTNRHEYFSFLFHQGIGTTVADLYLAWAYYFEAVGSLTKADEIYKMGLGARAQPLELIKHAQTQLQIMAAEGVRCRDDDEYNSRLLAHMGERRFALTSLHAQTKKQVVGSLRTDAAVKSRTPGLVLQEAVQPQSNVGPVAVFAADEAAEEVGGAAAAASSSMKSVVDSAIKAQENLCEPGPWSKCGENKKKGSLFSKKEIANNPGFEICEDSLEETQLAENVPSDSTSPGIQLPPGFIRQNAAQDPWNIPLTIPEETTALPAYLKKFVYPNGLAQEFSPEEIAAYRYWTNRMVRPPATIRVLEEMETFMGRINLPENFAARNAPQSAFDLEYYPFDGGDRTQPMCRVLSAVDGCHKSYEELLKEKYLTAKQKQRESDKQPPVVILVDSENSVEMELEDDMRAVGEEQQQACRQSGSPRSSESPFGFNETCSTQIFNLFIKPQSISTPNRGKGKDKQPTLPRCSLGLYKHNQLQQQREEAILESSMEENVQSKVAVASLPQPQQDLKAMPSPGFMQQPQQNTSPDMIHYGGKQLSVIMETTESSASSGGCQTASDATITNTKSGGETRFGASTIDYGIASLTAKPRKSILKRPSCLIEDIPQSPVESSSPPQQQPPVEEFSIFVDEPEVGVEKTSAPTATVKRDENSFLMPAIPPAATNISVYRDSMDFFGGPAPVLPPPPPRAGDFAMPLPPKPKAFLPLYNDSMEHFMEKAKTVPRFPVPQDEQHRMEEEEEVHKKPDFEQPSKLAADFSIFHDSMISGGRDKPAVGGSSSGAIPKDKSLLSHSHSSKENHRPGRDTSPNTSLSPFRSFLQQRPVHNHSDDSGSFLDSPQQKKGASSRSKDAIYGTSTELTMPTIAAIDPLLLENSMTFPSMKELTANFDVKRFNNQSVREKSVYSRSMMPPLLVDESMTFNTLMKKESGANKSKAAASAAAAFNPNISILDLQKELVEDDVQALQPPPPPPIANLPQLFEESMTFNSLMRKEAKGIPKIAAGFENLNFDIQLPEPTTTTNLSKPKLLNDSITFNSLMKKDNDLFLKPANHPSNQSSFPMELPSSTAHGFSIFTSQKKAFAECDQDSQMRMEKSISPIPSVRHNEMDDLLAEEEEQEPADDIYKWENTLRLLPEADEPNPDLWYNDNLDTVTSEQQQRKAGVKEGVAKRIGDKEYVDPFDPDLINNFLATVDFVNYAHKLNECDMREKIPPIRQGGQLEICDQVFSVRKLVGKGAFGQIYSAKTTDGRLVALKQSRPCNLWEYYICMEVKFRLKEFNEDLLPALIDIEYALVAKNASVFVLPFCEYGNLLNVCNEVKRDTGRNLNEKIVMVLVTQILSIIDALHACQIIHADIKPDNFMLMGPIDAANFDRPILKLIDFGQAIDMQLFPANVEFSSSLATEGFTCTEMLENRPWTYQTDLFCVAGTIHTLLLGKYMAVQKGVCGYSVAKFPRYLQKVIWDEIFEHLLNVTDCRTMPNLQEMKLLLKQHISDHESATLDEIRKFNQIVMRVQVLDK